jgi:hypothetical protein
MSTEATGFAPDPGTQAEWQPLPVGDETPEAAPAPRKVRARKPVYRVRRLVETGEDPQITKFDTKAEARRYVETHHPRGREVYVEHPDGFTEHYSADLAHQGHDSGGWVELTDEETE